MQEKNGFTLIELVITVAVLAILTLGVIPLMQVSVKRQKEEQLRASLREMREAIDQFHREALAGVQYQVNQQQGQGQQGRPPQQGSGPNIFADPRVRVMITDQTIFSSDNPDRYPPDLDTLVTGVDVLPLAIAGQVMGGQGLGGRPSMLEQNNSSTIPKKKIYLRRIPDDPMTPEDESTGEAEWDFRSCYDSADTSSWGGENVFDVHSKSKGKALDGTNYHDW
jgi:general secretion pathway protein G